MPRRVSVDPQLVLCRHDFLPGCSVSVDSQLVGPAWSSLGLAYGKEVVPIRQYLLEGSQSGAGSIHGLKDQCNIVTGRFARGQFAQNGPPKVRLG